ncbi:MAG: SDR family oxidoreductase [Sulfitobacter sp.]|nr:SDR family oxidoreductase [Sulfitobacter sp.]
MSKVALVTGASSGIGKEFARYHAEKGGDVVLTARREETLKEIKAELEKEHGISAHVFACDLGKAGAAGELYGRIKKAGLDVDILINNAGFGGQGKHIDRALEDELDMIDLNVKALVSLTQQVAQEMVERGSGKILNVGSTAGFMPGPNQAVYFATKAFVKSFSEALAQEMQGTGVTVTLLAPGYVETEFAERSGLTGTKLVSGGGATPRSVAKHGYDAMRRGEIVTVNEKMLGFAVNWVIPLLPRRSVLKMVERMQAK